MYITEGSLEVKLPTIWTNEKQRWEESEKRGRKKIKKESASEEARQPSGQIRCTPVWREAHFEVKMYKAPGPDHFWKLRCQKDSRRCGAKNISKSKCAKHTRFGPLLEVEMLEKCTPLWREAHFKVKMYKTHQVRNTFGS